jgi:exodeoxyribonuclease VII large subunit
MKLLEDRKNRLAAEGLFDPGRKRPLPALPRTIGVITSPTGAAVCDIINIIGRRYKLAEIILYPALVQGDSAPDSLMTGLDMLAHAGVDVIIIGRGGGSIEDLWGFNNEALCRKIAACRIPIISAVGHETDFTICDFVADLRAPTPSAAAEIAVPDSAELKRRLGNVVGVTEKSLKNRLVTYRSKLETLSHSRMQTTPMAYIDDRKMSVLAASDRLDAAAEKKIAAARSAFAAHIAALEAMSPLKVLTRGYSAAFTQGGQVISSVRQLNAGDNFRLRMKDGEITAQTITTKTQI